MIRHIVLFKWKADASEEAIDRFVEAMSRFPSQNKDIQDWATGKEIAPAVFGGGSFDYGLTCLLPDHAAVERYRDHPYHLQLAAMLPEVRGNIVVFDYNIDGRA
ncbi:MAG: Dabb family protein [Chloroflexi bacterium]|nr:Dabb family protein [Chloroflexota bacterium]